jgi:hypothetical protein
MKIIGVMKIMAIIVMKWRGGINGEMAKAKQWRNERKKEILMKEIMNEEET